MTRLCVWLTILTNLSENGHWPAVILRSMYMYEQTKKSDMCTQMSVEVSTPFLVG